MHDFGHYIPFLGAFFGINVLFGAWDGVYGKLYFESSTEARKGEEKWEKDTATLDVPDDQKKKLENKRRRNTRIREWIKTGGRLVGRMAAGIIAIAFFFVPKNTPVPRYLAVVIALAAILPVLALFLMWLNNKGLEKIRARENEIYREAGQAGMNISAAEEGIQQTTPSPP